MSLGVVTPCSLRGVGTKLGWRLRDEHRLHVSQNYVDAGKMVSRMEKPRVMITILNTCRDREFESVVDQLSPLDVVLDCTIESDENIESRSSYCQENNTKYMSIRLDHGGVFVRGPHVVYTENKDLLKKIDRRIHYIGEIEQV